MARSRNIKPGLFTNDILAEKNEPLGRLLFIGLWCLADHKGDLEWRASRIKVQILPYDDCDIKQLAINLDKSGFVTFYSDGEKMYLRINNFEKHQNPHPNEKKKGSDVPGYTEKMRQLVDLERLTINRDKSRQDSEGSISDPADSLIPHPDSRSPQSDSAEPKGSPPADESPVVICIPTNKFKTAGEEYPVTEKQIIEWRETYPAVDVVQSLRQIRSWNLNNPAKRKTLRGMPAHIDKWLAKDQNRGGSVHAINQPNRRESLAERSWRESEEILADLERGEAGDGAVAPDAPAVWPQVGQSGGPGKA